MGTNAMAFLATFAAIVIARGLWLGDPAAIALHQLQNGALIVFAFFMITDPKTTPATAHYRLVQGVAVAVLAAFLQYRLDVASAPLFALVILAPIFALPIFHKETANEKTSYPARHFNLHRAGWSASGILRLLRR